MSKVPKGWKEIQLKDVLDYDQPNEYIVETPILEEETQIPVLTANKSFIKGYTNDTNGIYNNIPVIIFDDFTADNKFVNFPFKVKSSAMKILKLNDKRANLKFIFYQMQLIDVNTTTHKRYYISLFQNLPFIFPINEKNEIDLEKQQQIVDEIEKQFTRLEASAKDLRSVKEKLESYRKSILKAAFEGKLITGRVAKRTKIKELLLDIRYGTAKKCTYDDKNIAVLRIPNIVKGFIDINDLKYCSFTEDEFSKLKLKSSDILVIRSNGSKTLVGRSAIVTKEQEDYCFAGYLIRLRLNSDLVIPSFFNYYFQSGYIRNQIEKKAKSTSGVNNVNAREIGDMDINLFSLKDQEKIVQEIESQFSIIDKLEQTIDSTLQQTDLLRKSILKSAFEGKLVKEVVA